MKTTMCACKPGGCVADLGVPLPAFCRGAGFCAPPKTLTQDELLTVAAEAMRNELPKGPPWSPTPQDPFGVPCGSVPRVEPKALDVQVGGGHYKGLSIQPVEYIHKNGLGFFEGNVVKYVTRWTTKGGREDLLKARHYLDLLLELDGSAT